MHQAIIIKMDWMTFFFWLISDGIFCLNNLLRDEGNGNDFRDCLLILSLINSFEHFVFKCVCVLKCCKFVVPGFIELYTFHDYFFFLEISFEAYLNLPQHCLQIDPIIYTIYNTKCSNHTSHHHPFLLRTLHQNSKVAIKLLR